MRRLFGHHHGPALTHAQDFIRVGQEPDGCPDLIGIDEIQCFRHRSDVRGIQLAAHVLQAVGQLDLTGEVLRSGALPRGGIGNRQLEGVVALVSKPAAEA